MTTQVQAATDLYDQLKPGARQAARDYILSRTPPLLQEEMVAVYETDLQEQVDQTDPPVVVDAPLIWQDGTTLTCTLGNWLGAPSTRSYQWKVDGVNVGTSIPTYARQGGDVGKTATCTMIATNDAGASDPVASNAIVVT